MATLRYDWNRETSLVLFLYHSNKNHRTRKKNKKKKTPKS